MTEHDEDSVLHQHHQSPSSHAPEDTDLTEEVQDFRFLSTLSHNTSTTDNDPSPTLPRRGEKDFEPHGTNAQIATLVASRAAMHAALSRQRTHPLSKTAIVSPLEGTYIPSPPPEIESAEAGPVPVLYNAMVQSPKGPHFRTVGKVGPDGLLRLLPEEALYLLERGSLDLRWPATGGGEDDKDDPEENRKEEGAAGLPLSLQAAYACLVGKGGLTVERYTVYAGLKRSGYIVQRGPAWDAGEEEDGFTVDDASTTVTVADPATQQMLEQRPMARFAWLYQSLFSSSPTDPPPQGPLVAPGLYRSYNNMYKSLSIIPSHDPSKPRQQQQQQQLPSPSSPSPTTAPRPTKYPTPAAQNKPNPPKPRAADITCHPPPLRPCFHVWKPQAGFKKSAPGPPDFRIAVVSAHNEDFPTVNQLDGLLRSVPYDAPPPGGKRPSSALKHGWRNVILAVVDQGVVSYIRVGACAFAQEKLNRIPNMREQGSLGGKRGGKRGVWVVRGSGTGEVEVK